MSADYASRTAGGDGAGLSGLDVGLVVGGLMGVAALVAAAAVWWHARKAARRLAMGDDGVVLYPLTGRRVAEIGCGFDRAAAAAADPVVTAGSGRHRRVKHHHDVAGEVEEGAEEGDEGEGEGEEEGDDVYFAASPPWP